jgi:hypothetical protein
MYIDMTCVDTIGAFVGLGVGAVVDSAFAASAFQMIHACSGCSDMHPCTCTSDKSEKTLRGV